MMNQTIKKSDLKEEKTILTFGTFDLFRVTHLRFLKKCKSLGTKLVVGVSTDDVSKSRKKRLPVFTLKQRLEIIKNVKYVDEAFIEESEEKNQRIQYIKQHKASVLVEGEFYKGKFDYCKEICKLIYMDRVKGLRTSDLLDKICQRNLKKVLDDDKKNENDTKFNVDDLIIDEKLKEEEKKKKNIKDPNKTIVLTYGTFDLFHIGHLNIIKRCRKLGTDLIIAVSTDKFSFSKKQKYPLFKEEYRKEILFGMKGVSKVIDEHRFEQKRKDIVRENADIFTIGDDWKGKFDYLNDICKVVYLPRTKGISTTELIEMISKEKLKSLDN